MHKHHTYISQHIMYNRRCLKVDCRKLSEARTALQGRHLEESQHVHHQTAISHHHSHPLSLPQAWCGGKHQSCDGGGGSSKRGTSATDIQRRTVRIGRLRHVSSDDACVPLGNDKVGYISAVAGQIGSGDSGAPGTVAVGVADVTVRAHRCDKGHAGDVIVARQHAVPRCIAKVPGQVGGLGWVLEEDDGNDCCCVSVSGSRRDSITG